MTSYTKLFNNVHSKINDLMDKLTISGFRVGIYDETINLIIRNFYQLLKEAQYIDDSQKAKEAFCRESSKPKPQEHIPKGNQKGKDQSNYHLQRHNSTVVANSCQTFNQRLTEPAYQRL